MHELRIFSVVVFFVAFISGCKSDEKKITPDLLNFPQSANGIDDTELPQITFDSIEVNFGLITEGEKVLKTFRFQNTGNAPLIISQVEPSCGCTALRDWPKSPLAPGERGQISVEFNSTGKPGLANKSIFVQANTSPATTTIYIKGEVKGPDTKKDKQFKPFEPGLTE